MEMTSISTFRDREKGLTVNIGENAIIVLNARGTWLVTGGGRRMDFRGFPLEAVLQHCRQAGLNLVAIRKNFPTCVR